MSQAHTLPPRIAPVSFAGFERDFADFSHDLGGSFERFGFAVISDHGIPPGPDRRGAGGRQAVLRPAARPRS